MPAHDDLLALFPAPVTYHATSAEGSLLGGEAGGRTVDSFLVVPFCFFSTSFFGVLWRNLQRLVPCGSPPLVGLCRPQNSCWGTTLFPPALWLCG